MGGFLPVPDRVAFSVFGVDIMWYGLLVGGGMVAAVLMSYLRAQRHGLDRERILDLAIYCIPFAMIGARLYYVLFRWENYRGDILSILNIRQGGLAVHGGVLFGVGLGVFLLRKVWHQAPLKWVDLVAPAIALGQSVGRWGNYFNSEAHGTPTDLPWAIEADGQLVHPTFLYESVWCLLLCIFLAWLADSGRQKFDGQIGCLYLVLYSLERFFVESLRTDSLMIGPLRQAQVLSVCLIAAGIASYIYLQRKAKAQGA